MVRLVRKLVKGQPVYAEDAPATCPHGHDGALAPTWSVCPRPGCGRMGRQWKCRAVEDGEACGEVVLDPEHAHRPPWPGA